MKTLKDKVAVVTGGASGIGKALGKKFLECGMRVVIADIEKNALALTAAELGNEDRIFAVNVDVSKKQDMERLLSETLDRFGEVHVLCNNAGVAVNKPVWRYSQEDWEWVLGVNLWGVIHGLGVFVPVMLKQQTECHIVTTSSLHGFCSVPFHAPYVVSKHAIIALNEILYRELRIINASIGVSVLCPANVVTKIGQSERNRGAGKFDSELGVLKIKIAKRVNALTKKLRSRINSYESFFDEYMKTLDQSQKDTLLPIPVEEVAEATCNAMLEDIFYVIIPDEADFVIENRFADIIERRNPDLFI